jgi:glutamate formiminotransferase/glutamate formiminotransferase/formiminotetrahydrofolate cyclodeaminase
VTNLFAVPNVSEGRDAALIHALADAFAANGQARVLDTHSDADHHRSVFTLAAEQGQLVAAVLAGTRMAVERIDVMSGPRASERGEHPHVGALDVAPVVYLQAARRGAACAEALVLAHEIGELGVPVLLYGELAQGRTRAELRRGGVGGLAARLGSGELRADFGPQRLHRTAGATLVAAREPLVAFNLELAAPASVEDARRIAGLIREGGAEGLPGVRAIGVELRSAGPEDGEIAGPGGGEQDPERAAHAGRLPIAQVSTNVERPLEVPLATVVAAVRRHAEVARAELVGLAPRAALVGFPADVLWRGGDPQARTIENALGFR